MRTIKFRGKRLTDGLWVYGDLKCGSRKENFAIHTYDMNGWYNRGYMVDPDTVGQFTGLQDANGDDVYEGDIVRYQRNKKTYQVVFKDGIFWGEGEKGCGCAAHFFPSCEIIGNVFDNSELIKKGGES